MNPRETLIDSGGAEGAARMARFLETKLLIGTMIEIPTFEDDCEELAIHYSVDVSIPESFIGWLDVLRGGRAEAILETLGLANCDLDDGPDLLIPLNTITTNESLTAPNTKVHQMQIAIIIRGDFYWGEPGVPTFVVTKVDGLRPATLHV